MKRRKWGPGRTCFMFTVLCILALSCSNSQGNGSNSGDDGMPATQLLIPDYYNSRIVQIDGFSGTSWDVITHTDLGLDEEAFRPSDIAVDNEGHIYVANGFTGGSGPPALLRFDSFSDTSPQTLVTGDVGPAVAVAVDSENERVFYAYGPSTEVPEFLYWCDPEGNPLDSYEGFATDETMDLTVDENGVVYGVVLRDKTSDPSIASLDIDGESYSSSTLEGKLRFLTDLPPGITYAAPYLYIANTDGNEGEKILQVQTDLTVVDSFGSWPADTGSPSFGEFFHPGKFVCTVSADTGTPGDTDAFYLIDEWFANHGDAYNRLIRFEDMTAAGWQTFTAGDAGQSPIFCFFDYGTGG